MERLCGAFGTKTTWEEEDPGCLEVDVCNRP